MPMQLNFRKGLKLNIEGAVPGDAELTEVPVRQCAVAPSDYPGFVPKPAVKEGDTVGCGSPLLYDKIHPDVKLVSPLAGTVRAIVRGERRRILRVEVESGTGAEAPTFAMPKDRKGALDFLSHAGLLALMRQRPYDIVPNPADTVRDVFVTALDSAPLAAAAATAGRGVFTKADFEAGVAVLRLVTDGKVYVATGADWPHGSLSGAEMLEVTGRYPASNVSVQIEAVAPVNKGDTVWTLDGMTLARIGRTATSGHFCADTVVALNLPTHI